MEEVKISWGPHQTLLLQKDFGPTVGMDLRISIKGDYYLIERGNADEAFTEWVKIPLQLEADFNEQ